jgi:hypothetical protein|tara:strand:+ start:444 stop:1094 length:651 start_codon:yes stop_codon:yes gene_type:complete
MQEPNSGIPEVKFPNLRNPRETLAWFWTEADFKILLPAIPMAIFVILNWQTSEWIAILGSFIATAIAFYLNKQNGVIKMLTVMGFTIITISAVVGMLMNNAKAYVSESITTDLMHVIIFTTSIIVRKPLVGLIAREALPLVRNTLPVMHRIFVSLTVTFIAINLLTAITRIFLLGNASATTFVLINTPSSFIISGLYLATSGYFIVRAAKKENTSV